MNKLLMEENDRLQKQVSQLVYENGYYRQQTQSVRVSLSHRSTPSPSPCITFSVLSLPLLCLCSSLCCVRADDVVVAGGAGDHGHELRVGRHQWPPERGRGGATSPAARRRPCWVRTRSFPFLASQPVLLLPLFCRPSTVPSNDLYL
jgi:hypothetical protein